MKTPQVPVSVLMLTYNEEANLARCLPGLTEWVKDIVILDSYSTDRTIAVAQQYNVKVFQNKFEGHARQWLWGMRNIPFQHDWVFMHDPDQLVTPELRLELSSLFQRGLPPDVDGAYVRRRCVFRGKWLRFGGLYPKYMLRIVRRQVVFFDENEFDYRAYVPGKTVRIEADISEENLKERDISFWVEKHNNFAIRQAKEEILRAEKPDSWKTQPRFWGTPDQRILWLKIRWYRLPLYLRPFLYFGFRYFILLGFLDGKMGFIYHFLQAFWYRLLVDIKIEELRRNDQTDAGTQLTRYCEKSNDLNTSP